MEKLVLFTDRLRKRHQRIYNSKDFYCRLCNKEIKTDTMVYRITKGRFIHKDCYPKYRVDVKEEPTEKELDSFITTD
jgi:hypothetical protein